MTKKHILKIGTIFSILIFIFVAVIVSGIYINYLGKKRSKLENERRK